MKIFLACGMGNEETLLKTLLVKYPHSQLTVAGGKWDLINHTFPSFLTPIHTFIPHYYDQDTEKFWQEYDLFIDCSFNKKSQFQLSRQASDIQRRCIVLFAQEKISAWDSGESFHDLSQYFEYSHPAPLIIQQKLSSQQSHSLHALEELLHHSSVDAQSVDSKGYLNTLSPTLSQDPRWATGEMQDVCALSCGDKTVSLTSTEECRIDLDLHALQIKPYCEIQRQSPFFLEFRVGELNCMLFKQGRLMVNGTENINDGKYIYRWYV